MYRNKKFVTFFIVVCIVICAAFPAMADVNDLPVNTDSNAIASDSNAAIMTLDLTDDDYGTSLTSSIASITNTVDYSGVTIHGVGVTTTGGTIYVAGSVDSEGRFFITSEDYSTIDHFSGFGVRLKSAALPNTGTYLMKFDWASDFSFTYDRVHFTSAKGLSNAQSITSSQDVGSFRQSSGDLYFEEVVQVNNSNYFDVWVTFDSDNIAQYLGGIVKVNFSVSSSSPSYSTAGSGTTSDDVQDEINSSLGELSSSMADQAENTGIIADAVENLAEEIVAGMEPHYDNVLTQLHHITEQLHAFWDQLYNMFYLPQYARLGEILDALNSLGPNLTGSLQALADVITSKLQSVQDAIVGKIQESTEEIVNGFDNSELNAGLEQLGTFIDDASQSEQDLLEQVGILSEYGSFDFPDLGELSIHVLENLSTFGIFFSGCFLSMGEFIYILALSLALSLVSIILGLNRLK